ncbi:MAG: CBS domain-containing protein [Byssovorax sp.]
MSEAASKTVRVRDIMSVNVFTLSGRTSVDDAARSLTYHKVSGAPVIDQGRIVGVVSNTDLVHPRYRSTPERTVTVHEAMTKIVYAVRPGDAAMAAARLMVKENIHRAIVVDEQGKLAGLVTPMDILKAIVEGKQVDDLPPELPADPAITVEYVDLRVLDAINEATAVIGDAEG